MKRWPSALQSVVPAVLPQPRRDGYRYAQLPATLDTNFGLVTRRRRIHESTPAMLDVSFSMRDVQWDYFDGFYWHELNAGTEWFLMPLLVRGVIEEVEVMFLESPPDYALRGVNGASFSMRLMTRKSLAPSAAAFGGVWTEQPLFIG